MPWISLRTRKTRTSKIPLSLWSSPEEECSKLTRRRNPVEYMAIDEPFNPLIHRIKGAVKERAVHPSGPVPSIPPILTKFAGPPEDIVEAAKSQIDTLIQTAEVKKGNGTLSPAWLSLCLFPHLQLTNPRSTSEGKGPQKRNRKASLRPRHRLPPRRPHWTPRLLYLHNPSERHPRIPPRPLLSDRPVHR